MTPLKPNKKIVITDSRIFMLESNRHIVDWQTPPNKYRSDLPETM